MLVILRCSAFGDETVPASGMAGAGPLSGSLLLTNTSASPGELLANPRAILLENARFDTTYPVALPPAALRTAGDPGAYLVQSRDLPGRAFWALLAGVHASVVAYIPNRAFLVTLPPSALRPLQFSPLVQAVLPYQPFYKLKAGLLSQALAERPLAGDSRLNVLLFPGAEGPARAGLMALGAEIEGAEPSPFGRVLHLRVRAAEAPGGGAWLSALAQLPGVEEIELAYPRRAANDLSRVTLGVAADPVAIGNYLGLTGSNVLVAVNDTGVSSTHPDLHGRVWGDVGASLTDTNGHGTHVAAIIAGSGLESGAVTNAAGSEFPSAAGGFRGLAPQSRIFATSGGTDGYLQTSAASTNALLSNNSWTYSAGGYDLAAASYDAATRDALPGVSGDQPVLFVFAAGNAGNGLDTGVGGVPDSILSPATAKNVLTVGALQQARHVDTQVWGRDPAQPSQWLTNQPWAALTGSSNLVAGFSSRGNVGIGLEGQFGRFKPDLVAPGTFVVSARPWNWDQGGYYSPTNASLVFSNFGNTMTMLSNLNATLATQPPPYRYESGTSMAAGTISGMLALLQEFLQARLGLTPSPALLKALLINGANLSDPADDLCVTNLPNAHGWGLPRLPAILPSVLTNLPSAAGAPLFWFDQDSAGALATGESRTRVFSLSPAAQSTPLRVTLVWTDPAGNPVAGLKLVNDLDLSVTNLDTGEVFWGNDIPSGAVCNSPWDPTTTPNTDRVNNVENVFLPPPLGSQYSVTVTGRSVNVNAVSSRADAIVQDYALVVSGGAAAAADALVLTDTPVQASPMVQATTVTNQFDPSGLDWGAVLAGQIAGAQDPLPGTNTIPWAPLNGAITLGDVSQWQFFTVSNDPGYTNAIFATFRAHRLSLDGTDVSDVLNGTLNQVAADIDLYVSQDAGLTNLDPTALELADKSLGRGGDEAIIYTNAQAAVYYVGVKCESRQGAEFDFAGVFSQTPFNQIDAEGNETVRGFPAPSFIPAAAGGRSGVGTLLAVASQATLLRRVVVTNTLTTADPADLAGRLSHGQTNVFLNRDDPGPAWVGRTFVYDDSPIGTFAGPQPSDGPGSLNGFCGLPAAGQWLLEQFNAGAGAATNDSLYVWLEHQRNPLTGIWPHLAPGTGRNEYLEVPLTATNLMITPSLLSGAGPVTLQVWPANAGIPTAQGCTLTPAHSGGIVIDKTATPPLNPGLYVLTLSNLGPDEATVEILGSLGLNTNGVLPRWYTSTGAVAIAPAAVTSARLNVQDERSVVSAQVGVRIDHPRISDLALYLVSPAGTRVLLDENRGGNVPGGMGADVIVTNVMPVSSSGGAAGYTNVLETGQTSGTISIDYQFYAIPDEMSVYYQGVLIYTSGLASYGGHTNVDYGPGTDTTVTVIMDQGLVIDPNDAWDYTVTATHPGFVYTTFTEDTNLTLTPIKFAIPPFTTNSPAPAGGLANGIYYLPEASLGLLAGAPAAGEWRLEIVDTRSVPAGTNPVLLGWQLGLQFADQVPLPIALAHHQPQTNTVAAGHTQFYSVAVPPWAQFATNALLSASAPLTLAFDQLPPPEPFVDADDYILLSAVTSGSYVLSAAGPPPQLNPGASYYLAVANTNPGPVTFCVEVDFDVPLLQDGVSAPFSIPADGYPKYFGYDASSNANLLVFQLQNLNANGDLYLNPGLPFPSPASGALFLSANPGAGQESVVVFTNSYAGPESSNRWYLGAVNADVIDLSGSVLAYQFSVYGTTVSVTAVQLFGNSLWLTWNSLPGNSYHLLGAAGLSGGVLAPISPTLVANGFQSSFAIALPSAWQTIVVSEGPAPISSFSAPAVDPPLVTSSGILLQWNAGTNARFQVQWSPSLVQPIWTTLPAVITAPTGSFSFLDDGSQTGGFDTTRFYRLLAVP